MLPSVARATLRGPRQLKTHRQGRSNGLVGQLEKIPVGKAGPVSPLRRVFDGVPGAIICPGKAYVHSVTSQRHRSLHCALETEEAGDV